MLHVVHLSFYNDPQGRKPQELLQAWPSLIDIAECAARGGMRVSVVQAAAHSERIDVNGIPYYFLPFGRSHRGLVPLLEWLAPEVIHVQGLGFARGVLSLARFAPDTPIVLQDHADGVPRFWHRPLWARGLAAATGVVFCTADQAAPFIAADLLKPPTHVYEVPESTSRFQLGDRMAARRELNIAGDPVVAWVGHLDDNKDPLTVLDGIALAARHLPGLRLWCCFGNAPLLDPVRRRIETDPLLCNRVRLLGPLPHDVVESLLQAADLFVLGSHREGSGYALIEALACGATPVVTDIPSFRALTGQGRIGELWSVGSADGLCRALQSAAERLASRTRVMVREHFDRELSFDAVGAKWSAIYADVIQRFEQNARRPQTVAQQ